jgi:L-asparagine transporter-like permease
MGELTKKYFIYLLLLTCILMSLLTFFADMILADIAPKLCLFGSILLFGVYEFVQIYFINKKKSATDLQLTNMYLAFMVGIFGLALILLAVYGLTIKIEGKNFALLFVIIFVIYLVFSVLYLKNREKKEKIC